MTGGEKDEDEGSRRGTGRIATVAIYHAWAFGDWLNCATTWSGVQLRRRIVGRLGRVVHSPTRACHLTTSLLRNQSHQAFVERKVEMKARQRPKLERGL